MSRDGELVRAEQEARDEAERLGLDQDYKPDRDEEGVLSIRGDDPGGALLAAVDHAVARERLRRSQLRKERT